jgi:hypothetical protein
VGDKLGPQEVAATIGAGGMRGVQGLSGRA